MLRCSSPHPRPTFLLLAPSLSSRYAGAVGVEHLRLIHRRLPPKQSHALVKKDEHANVELSLSDADPPDGVSSVKAA